VLQIRDWYSARSGGSGMWPWSYWVRLVFYGVMFGVLSSIRKDVLVPALLSVAATVGVLTLPALWAHGAPARARVRALALAALTFAAVFIGVQTFLGGIRAAWFVRDHVYTMRPGSRIFGHPTWHVLYMSLGFIPNELGIKWDDGVGWEHVRRLPQNKGIQYATPEHERASRALFFDTIRAHPDLLWRNLVAKSKFLYEQQTFPLYLTLAAFLVLLAMSSGHRSTALLYFLAWLACFSIPILVYPDRVYYLDLMTTGVLAISAAGVVTAVMAARGVAATIAFARSRFQRQPA
jgi:hypothetical protein